MPLRKAPVAEQVGADLREGRRRGGDDRFYGINGEFLIFDQCGELAFAFRAALKGLADQRSEFGGQGVGGLAGDAAAGQQRRGGGEGEFAVGGDFVDRCAAVHGVLDRVVIIDDRLVRLVLGQFGADVGAGVGETARRTTGDGFDARDAPAEAGLDRADQVALPGGEGGFRGGGGAGRGIGGLGEVAGGRGRQARGLCCGGERRAAAHLGRQRIGGRLIGSNHLRKAARFAGGILRGIVLIDFGDLGVGDCGNRYTGRIEQRILDHAAFRHGEFGGVLGEVGFERGVAGVGGRREGAGGNEGRLTAALFEQQRGIGLRHAGGEARHAGDRSGDLFDQQLLAQVAAQLRLGHAVLAKEGLERGLVEAARHTGKGGDVGNAAVDQPLADAKAHFGRELVEGHPFNHLIEHLVEPARFDKCRHRHPRLVLPRLIIGKPHAVAQLANADFLAADFCDIGAADAAKGRISGDVAQRESHADKGDEAEREDLAERRGKHAADGGNHGAGNLSARRGDARLRDALETWRHGIKARKGLFMAAQGGLPIAPARR